MNGSHSVFVYVIRPFVLCHDPWETDGEKSKKKMLFRWLSGSSIVATGPSGYLKYRSASLLRDIQFSPPIKIHKDKVFFIFLLLCFEKIEIEIDVFFFVHSTLTRIRVSVGISHASPLIRLSATAAAAAAGSSRIISTRGTHPEYEKANQWDPNQKQNSKKKIALSAHMTQKIYDTLSLGKHISRSMSLHCGSGRKMYTAFVYIQVGERASTPKQHENESK